MTRYSSYSLFELNMGHSCCISPRVLQCPVQMCALLLDDGKSASECLTGRSSIVLPEGGNLELLMCQCEVSDGASIDLYFVELFCP